MKRILFLLILPLLCAFNTTAQTVYYNTYTILGTVNEFEIEYHMEFTAKGLRDLISYCERNWLHVTGSRSSEEGNIILNFYADAISSPMTRECEIVNSNFEPLIVRQEYRTGLALYNDIYEIPIGGGTFLVEYFIDPVYIQGIYTYIYDMITDQRCRDWLSILEYGVTSNQTLLVKYRATANEGSSQRTCYILGHWENWLMLQQNTANTPPQVHYISRSEEYTMPGLRSYVGLSGSETGVTYNFYNSGQLIGSLPGTGEALIFDVYGPGEYTAKAVRTIHTTNMIGSAKISYHPLLPRLIDEARKKQN